MKLGSAVSFFCWLGVLGIFGMLLDGCQPRPKNERTIQISGGQAPSETVAQSAIPVPILATDRILQTMKLARILITGIAARDLSQISGCRQWSRDAGVLTFVDCEQGKVSFSGQAILRSNASGELQGFDLEMNVTEFDRVGSRLIRTRTKMDLDISQLQPLGGVQTGERKKGEQSYEGALRLTEEGEDLGKMKRSMEMIASRAHFSFRGAVLESLRLLGQASVKVQREKKKVNSVLWMVQSDPLTFQEKPRFWKGGLSFAESQDSGVPRTDVVFAEGMISIPRIKVDRPVFCRAEKSELEELQCLLSDLYRSGPGE